MLDQILRPLEQKMAKTLEHLEDELTKVRSSRAQAGLVDGLKVEVYGQDMVLKSIASINTPDAKTILIQPWDKSNLAVIEKAIRESQSLGLNPSNDGNMIRLNLPPLTEERRTELVKLVSEKIEQTKVSLRNTRHEALAEGRRLHKDKKLTDDDIRRLESELNKLIETYNNRADGLFTAKHKEMMEI